MNLKNKLNIALVKPPLQGHQLRGIGVYTERQFASLKEKKDINISLINYDSDINNYDIVHYPYFDPFFLTLPLIKKKPTVVTVHDLIPLIFPKYFPPGLKGQIKWLIQRVSLKTSRVIITDSNASKSDILNIIGINKAKVDVIYLGVDEKFQIINERSRLLKIRNKYQLPENFLLHVGDVNYNKNILGLIRAFHRVAQKHPYLKLVLIGQGFINYSPQLSEIVNEVDKLKLNNQVIRIGYIPENDLIEIYNLANIYVQISYAEGFGLPVLEAMSCGCPVIVSNLSSLPELVDKSGVLVNPYNIEEVAQKILNLYDNQVLRKENINKGLERVKLFTWSKCADETIKIYKKLV